MGSVYRTEEGKEKLIRFYGQIVDAMEANVEQHHIKTTYGKTFVIEAGEKTADVLVLLHGSSTNSAMWAAEIEQLSGKYHIYAIDILGECGKSEASRLSFKSTHYVTWLAEVLQHFKIAEATIIGCSLGGWIAAQFAMLHPSKTQRIILIATAGITPVKASAIIWIIITSFLGKWGFRKLNKMVYGKLKIGQEALEFAKLIKENYKPRTDVLPIFKDKQLAGIKIPCCFIGGEKDCFYNSAKTDYRLWKLISKYKGKVIAKTGHVITGQAKHIEELLK